MPIGPYGGAPGFRSPAMRSPRPMGGDGRPFSQGGEPTMNPRTGMTYGSALGGGLGGQRPAGTQMFSGVHSPSSMGGVGSTPFENYAATAGPGRMNQQEFRQSGQVGDYSNVNMMRSALGLDPAAHPFAIQAARQQGGGPLDALRKRAMRGGRQPTGRGGGLAPGVYGGGTFNPQPSAPGTYTAPYSTFGPNGTNPLPIFGGTSIPWTPPNPALSALPTTMPINPQPYGGPGQIPYSTVLR